MQTQTGILEVIDRKDGRLRVLDNTLITGPNDPVVSAKLIDKYQLRAGQTLEVQVAPGQNNGQGDDQQGQGDRHSRRNRRGRQRGRNGGGNNNRRPGSNAPRVQEVISVDGHPPDAASVVPRMEDLTSIDPKPRLTLEYPGCPAACRLIDMFCPIGYGTRGMIVSPPKAGKTTLLQNIAVAIEKNHPEVEVFALLIDERPEEVTDFRRNVPCQVLASSNDHPPERHVGLAIVAIERAKRMAEQGKDVVILLDSLTRVGRAFNTAPGRQQVGRTLSGGVDAGALAVPKQLFGAARNIEEGGSLTIIATALIDTGSRGDQVIFEEFKGTGNMELILDRKIAEQRIFPAIDLAASGTRKEHLLLGENELTTINALRRRLLNMPPPQQIEQLLKALERFKTNADLVGSPQSPARA